MSINKVKNGWQVRYQFGRDGDRTCETFPSWELAKRHETKLKTDYLERKHFPHTVQIRLTLSDFIDQYIRDHVSKLSWGRYVIYDLEKIREGFGQNLLTTITQELIEKWLSDVSQKEQWKQATINKYVALLKTLFKKAVQWKKIYTSPAAYLEKRDPKNERTRYASHRELDRLWQAASPRLTVFLIASLNTGMRKGRIETLDWKDVDLERRTIRVQNRKGREYFIRINSAIYEVLEGLPARSGRVFDTTNLRKEYVKACQKAGIDSRDLHIHDLRHTLGTYMTEKTKDLNMTQKALGHSTPKMTDRYRHVIDERLLEAFESVQFRPNKSVDKVSTQGLKEAVSDSL